MHFSFILGPYLLWAMMLWGESIWPCLIVNQKIVAYISLNEWSCAQALSLDHYVLFGIYSILSSLNYASHTVHSNGFFYLSSHLTLHTPSAYCGGHQQGGQAWSRCGEYLVIPNLILVSWNSCEGMTLALETTYSRPYTSLYPCTLWVYSLLHLS